MNILFICSRNKWRSRTAETIFRNHPVHQVRSAGTKSDAEVRISEKLLIWADLVLVMEIKHKSILLQRFGEIAESRTIHVLDIPDDYQYMDPELIEMLQTAVQPYFENED